MHVYACENSGESLHWGKKESQRGIQLENCSCGRCANVGSESALSAAGVGDTGALQSVQQEFPLICAGWQHVVVGGSVFSSSTCLMVPDTELAGRQSAENISVF